MTAKAAKVARRESRKVIGSDAVGIINAHTLMLDNTVLPLLNAIGARFEVIELRLRHLEAQIKPVGVNSAPPDAPHAD